MKYFLSCLLCLSFCTTTLGQNLNKIIYPNYAESTRNEIRIPSAIKGTIALKADLHTHTFFSDGSVSPEMRVNEAWKTGLDILAITDHIEYRPNSPFIQGDCNSSYERAKKEAENKGIILIKGSEITRQQPQYGHFNALFINDANKLKLDDPKEAIKEAVNQGGFIIWNHPAWAVDTCRMYEFQKDLLRDKLIHGIEVFNNTEFYPLALKWANERGLTIFSGSDVHTSIYANDGVHGSGSAVSIPYIRPFTIIFSKDKTLESIKSALYNRQTITYFSNHLAGDASLLTKYFWASVSVEKVLTDNKHITYRLQNLYDIPFFMYYDKKRVALLPGTSIDIQVNNFEEINIRLENVFINETEVLNITLRSSLL